MAHEQLRLLAVRERHKGGIMTEWGVVGVIVVLVSLFIAIGTPIVRLNSAVTTLVNQIDTLQNCIKDLRQDNKESHAKIWERVNSLASDVSEIRTEVDVIKAKMEDE